LALQAAKSLQEGSGDEVWFVDLTSLTDPSLVAASVAKVLWTCEEVERSLTETLVDVLRDRKLLVVLDNCEHVINAAAALADALLRRCPGVALLATSREPLGIDGEHVYRVPSLSMPRPDDALAVLAGCESVRLFVERVRQYNAAFSLEGDTAAIVGRLCRRLDGIPFAIELAAARLRSLSARDLDARLNKRFELLTGGSRSALPRHQTLQALIDWSWDLLTPEEQQVLTCLSVFAGGFDLAAAQRVCPGGADVASVGVDGFGPHVKDVKVLDLLAALVDKSLVHADYSADSVRYRLLETIRDYAGAKLEGRGEAERNRVARAHRDHFMALVEEAQPHLRGQDELEWIDRLDLELDNIRVALNECLEDCDPQPGLRLAEALSEFWNIRGYGVEGTETLRAHLGRPAAQSPTLRRGQALVAAGHLVKDYVADYPLATAFADEALRIARAEGDDNLAVRALYVLATVRNSQGDHIGCLNIIEEALPVARRQGDPRSAAQLLNVQGWARDGAGGNGWESYAEAAVLYRQAGDRRGAAAAIGNLGFLALNAGDFDAARGPIGDALRVFRQLGDRHGQVTFALNSGYIAYLDGHDVAADHLFRECLDLARRIAARSLVACATLGLAVTATRAGNPLRAAALHGAFDSLHQELGAAEIEAIEARMRNADHLRLRVILGDDSFERAYEMGRALPFDDSVNLASRTN